MREVHNQRLLEHHVKLRRILHCLDVLDLNVSILFLWFGSEEYRVPIAVVHQLVHRIFLRPHHHEAQNAQVGKVICVLVAVKGIIRISDLMDQRGGLGEPRGDIP